MKKKNEPKIWIVATVFMALMVTSVFAVLAIGIVSATTWYVEEGESIQAAVDAADPRDTIIVRGGTYIENVDVNVNNLTIKSENGSASTIIQAANPDDHVFEVTADYVNIYGFSVKGATGWYPAGIYLNANYCNISNNNCSNNHLCGIYLYKSNNSVISNNNCSYNGDGGIMLCDSNNNSISNNIVSNNVYGIGGFGISLCRSSENMVEYTTCVNNDFGIHLEDSMNNKVKNNICENNYYIGIHLIDLSNNNIIINNNISNNDEGICLIMNSSNNYIYLNNFINNSKSVKSFTSTNIWISISEITYTYNGTTYTNYLGNHWSDYTGSDADGDGIGDTPYIITYGEGDNCPLMVLWENYFAPTENIFDTGAPENPYPSIMGNHTGTIKPNHTVIAIKLYTYPCIGTGGHTEYAEIRNATWNATATWEGYASDWHNITFDKTVVLLANETYNYTIRTGSYPQIHHNTSLLTANGWINCTGFIDANGKRYNNWVPAIRVW